MNKTIVMGELSMMYSSTEVETKFILWGHIAVNDAGFASLRSW